MKNSRTLAQVVEDIAADFEALSDRVWAVPETCYTETKSCAEHAEELARQGFRVETGVADIPTSVVGEAGEGGPVIAFLGEFDALPGLSQEAGVDEHRPVENGGAGHGCGHNLLGSAAMLAATAVKTWLEENGVPGRVRYYGCPAEEGGGAKAFMVRAGLFDDVDAAFTWHPESFTEVLSPNSLANMRCDFLFKGTSAHAAIAPHLGRSALDAVELMNVGANYMREHMPLDCRIHYAYLDAGGIAPNVVQGTAAVRYSIRSPNVQGMNELYERLSDIARGASMMTGTEVTIRPISAVSNLMPNTPLEDMMWQELVDEGPVPFDEDDRAFARKMQATFPKESVAFSYRRFGMKPDYDKAAADFIVPRENKRLPMPGSTDVADVSWVVPLVQLQVATCAIGTPFHSWQLVAQGKSSLAKKGMVHAGKVMARGAKRLFEDSELIAAAKADLADRTEETPYVTPLPEGTMPPIREMAGAVG